MPLPCPHHPADSVHRLTAAAVLAQVVSPAAAQNYCRAVHTVCAVKLPVLYTGKQVSYLQPDGYAECTTAACSIHTHLNMHHYLAGNTLLCFACSDRFVCSVLLLLLCFRSD